MMRSFLRIAGSVPEPRNIAWDRRTWIALVLLLALWAALFGFTWGRWGDLSQDVGREMYVPSVLAGGKTLYTDVWYPYMPGAPYFNALLFRIFGVKLQVLYWAGALAALGCATILFACGLHLVSRIGAWCVGAAVLLQAFQSSFFSFPLACSFGALYAYVAACACLWILLRGCGAAHSIWIMLASVASAAALLNKLEIGLGCFAALGLVILCRTFKERALRSLCIDVIATMAGFAVCAAVAAWMVSLRGAEFITQENLMSWPTSFFMRTYGQYWLNKTGLGWGLDSPRNLAALVVFGSFWAAVRWATGRFEINPRRFWLWAGFGAAISLGDYILDRARLLSIAKSAISYLFFPPAMLLIIGLTMPLAVYVWRSRGFSANWLKAIVGLSLPVLIAARSLAGMNIDYAIYTNGPGILGFVFLMTWLAAPNNDSPGERGRWAMLPALTVLAAVVCLVAPKYLRGVRWRPIITERGTVYARTNKVQGYGAAIRFMQEKEREGARVLVLPDDASLYFLAGASAPTRVFVFSPGLLAPGKMLDEVIAEIEQQNVEYLLWSGLRFVAYPVQEFGADFDRELGDYFRTHYVPIRKVLPEGDGWNATIWARISTPTLAVSQVTR